MQFSLRWLLPVVLILAGVPARAKAEDKEIVIPLNEKLLQRFDLVTQHLGAKLRTDKALAADFKAVGKDKAEPAEATPESYGALITRRHPRVAAALVAEGWTPGDFYIDLFTLIGAYSALESYDPKKRPTDGYDRNVAFVAAHRAQVEAALGHLPQDKN